MGICVLYLFFTQKEQEFHTPTLPAPVFGDGIGQDLVESNYLWSSAGVLLVHFWAAQTLLFSRHFPKVSPSNSWVHYPLLPKSIALSLELFYIRISAKYSLFDGSNPSDLIDPTHYSLAVDGYAIPPNRLALYQEEVVRWLSDFLYTGPRALLPKLQLVSFSPMYNYFPISHPSGAFVHFSTSSSGSDLVNQAGNDGTAGGSRNPQSSEGSTSGVDLSSQSEHQRPGITNSDQRSTGNATGKPNPVVYPYWLLLVSDYSISKFLKSVLSMFIRTFNWFVSWWNMFTITSVHMAKLIYRAIFFPFLFDFCMYWECIKSVS